MIGIGGDACHPPQRAFMRDALPASAIHITYGTTECGPRVSTLAPELLLEKAGSIGRAFPESRIEIRTEQGAPCGPGETGFLHIQTPSLMTGYLNTDGSSDDLPRDHWFLGGLRRSHARHRGLLQDPVDIGDQHAAPTSQS